MPSFQLESPVGRHLETEVLLRGGESLHGAAGGLHRTLDLHDLVLLDQTVGDRHQVLVIPVLSCQRTFAKFLSAWTVLRGHLPGLKLSQ